MIFRYGLGTKFEIEGGGSGSVLVTTKSGLPLTNGMGLVIQYLPAGMKEANAACKVLKVVTDIKDAAQCKRLAEATNKEFGRIDGLANSAFQWGAQGTADGSDLNAWREILETNVIGTMTMTQAVVPFMKAQGGGAIVNIASNAGLLPRAHDPVYSISKAALVALTKSLALCHAPDRIRVNAICPGPVEATRMMDADLDRATDRQRAVRNLLAASPLAQAHARMIAPEEVAQAVLYLVSDASLMVTGTAIAIDGGKSLGVPPK
jgi:NAD(P)-dependent dehydrogenase (short-subunit alcohol dehydrogenase family)